MARNKSVNGGLTKKALEFYYIVAQEEELLPNLLSHGVSEGAIKVAISRGGRISQTMIDGFFAVMGASKEALAGEIDISDIAAAEDGVTGMNRDEFNHHIDSYISHLFAVDKTMGDPCKLLIQRVARFVHFISMGRVRTKGDGIDIMLLKERKLIDEAFAKVIGSFPFSYTAD